MNRNSFEFCTFVSISNFTKELSCLVSNYQNAITNVVVQGGPIVSETFEKPAASKRESDQQGFSAKESFTRKVQFAFASIIETTILRPKLKENLVPIQFTKSKSNSNKPKVSEFDTKVQDDEFNSNPTMIGYIQDIERTGKESVCKSQFENNLACSLKSGLLYYMYPEHL